MQYELHVLHHPARSGKERSRPLPDVVDEVKRLVAGGYQEIILTGVQISAFRDATTGKPLPTNLRDLVAAILARRVCRGSA